MIRDLNSEDQFSTPKRKLSPDEMTPVGRVRKLTTEMEASPQLRGQLQFHLSPTNPMQRDGAPDLISGIGRLQLRPLAPTERPGEANLEVTGPALESNVPAHQSQHLNVAQRLVREMSRPRALSIGGRRGSRATRRNVGQRSFSLEGQRRIDLMFSPGNSYSARDKENKGGNMNLN